MRVVEVHEYRFPSSLLPALVNNEPVINEEDQSYFNTFIDKLEQFKKEYKATDYVVDYSDTRYFSHTNSLYAVGCNVTDIKVLFLR
jgi:predicted GTPase